MMVIQKALTEDHEQGLLPDHLNNSDEIASEEPPGHQLEFYDENERPSRRPLEGSDDQQRRLSQPLNNALTRIGRHFYDQIYADESMQHAGDLGGSSTTIGHNYSNIRGEKKCAVQILGDFVGSDGLQYFTTLLNSRNGAANGV